MVRSVGDDLSAKHVGDEVLGGLGAGVTLLEELIFVRGSLLSWGLDHRV